MKKYKIIGLVLAFVLTNAISLVIGYVANSPKDRNEMLKLINEYRASVGVKPLVFNLAMCPYADKRLIEVHTNFSHDGFRKNLPDYLQTAKLVGENLSKNDGGSESTVNGWIHSPTHRANIVNPKFTDTCITNDIYDNNSYAVQQFASF